MMPFDGVTTTHEITLPQQLVAARMRYARNQIANGKWCQKTITDPHGNHCVVGWLEGPHQHIMPDISTLAIRYVWHELPISARHSGHTISDLARYNDTHTRHTIIRLLNRAIVAMETMNHA